MTMPTAPEHEALMRLVEAYADARHEHGAPEYNAHTMAPATTQAQEAAPGTLRFDVPLDECIA